MKDLECPYCESEQDINLYDGFGFEEDKAHEMECDSCEKTFVFYTSISYSYSPQKADCLNGSPHRLRVVDRINYVRSTCKDCEFEKMEWKVK